MPNGYWLLEIDRNNTPTFYTDCGFHAIGSGSGAAQVANGMLGHYGLRDRSSWHLKLVAHRTVSNCIKAFGMLGVGGASQLWYSENGGAFSEAANEELTAIQHGLDQWETIERESLTSVPAPRAGGVEPEGEPLPEPLAEGKAGAAKQSPVVERAAGKRSYTASRVTTHA
jgi:hypothetical protein